MNTLNPDRTPSSVIIGEIVGLYGLRGEVKVKPLTDFPERFQRTKEIRAVHPSGREMVLHPQKARQIRRIIVMQCKEFSSLRESEPWVGAQLHISPSELTTLPEGRYYIFQIVGLDVFTEEGLYLGKVSEVLTPGANDVYVVALSEDGRARAKDCDGETLLIPVIDEVILETDLERGKLTVRLLEGLL